MPHPSGKLQRKRAYTLIELVLVLALLCVIAGMAAPTLRYFVHGREGSDAAEQFVAVAQWAHTQAISRGEVYRLNINPAGRTYWVTVQRDAVFQSPGEDFGRVFTFPDSQSVDCDILQQPDGQYVTFQPSGRSEPANVRLTSQSGEVTQIGCLSATELFQVIPPGQQVAWGVHPQQTNGGLRK